MLWVAPSENDATYVGDAALTRPAATHSHPMGEGLGVSVQDERPRELGPPAAGSARASRVVFGALAKHTGRALHVLQNFSRRGRRPVQPRAAALPYKLMHGLWSMGQMMFTKYIIVVDDDVDVHNTSEVLFRLCANTDPQRDSIFTKGPSGVLDHATSEIASGSKLGIDATKKLPGEGINAPGRRSSKWMPR